VAAAALACAQMFEVTPASVRQGETARVRTALNAASARMKGRTVRLFQQADGSRLGLMPVPATEAPGVYKLELLASSGAVLRSTEVRVLNSRFPSQNVKLAESVAALAPSAGETEAVSAFRKSLTETRHWTEPLAIPVAGCMISPFGVRRLLNGKATGDYHRGVDQRAPAGHPVRAVAAGVVRVAHAFNLRGGTVGIDHGQGLESIYLHMSKLAAKEGATVERGEVIGYVGSTGRSSGPHLHWSLYVNEVPVNPAQWIKMRPCTAARHIY
jgi:murein DD-endopeptidase MepM/ murein hydrolase activator NlpD